MELVVHRSRKHIAEEYTVNGMQSGLFKNLKDRFTGYLQQALIPMISDRDLPDLKYCGLSQKSSGTVRPCINSLNTIIHCFWKFWPYVLR